MTNKSNRKKTRKLLFQELYAHCFNINDDTLFFESFIKDVFTFEIDKSYLEKMKKIILSKEQDFLNIISKYSPRFDVSSMSISYILPIYIGLAEMLFLDEEIPGKVSMNEAIEIAKVYGDDSSKKIVNGVLHKVLIDIEELQNNIGKTPEKEIQFSLFKKAD